MPKINYDFDTEQLPPPASAGGRKLRILAIFLAVAAATGALVYCFRPMSEPESGGIAAAGTAGVAPTAWASVEPPRRYSQGSKGM